MQLGFNASKHPEQSSRPKVIGAYQEFTALRTHLFLVGEDSSFYKSASVRCEALAEYHIFEKAVSRLDTFLY